MSKLQHILQNFIKHTEVLFEKDENDDDGFTKEFNILKEDSLVARQCNVHLAEEGALEFNIKKNRYKDILPYDETRVILINEDGSPGGDYINANFIKDIRGNNGYIAAQGPLPHTVNSFWAMMWQFNIEVIVMVCRDVENARIKCEKYWATKGETRTFKDISVKLLDVENISKQCYVRQMSIRKGSEERKITQFHYVGWLDHDVPTKYSDIIDLIVSVRECQHDDSVPIVIHCSAGCGRTGTICAVDYAWNKLRNGTIDSDFSLFDIIQEMRAQRPSMVQTPDQYRVVHLAVVYIFEQHLKMISCHNYENVNLDAKMKAEEKPPVLTESNNTTKPSRPSQDNYENHVIMQQHEKDASEHPATKDKRQVQRAIAFLNLAHDSSKSQTSQSKTENVIEKRRNANIQPELNSPTVINATKQANSSAVNRSKSGPLAISKLDENKTSERNRINNSATTSSRSNVYSGADCLSRPESEPVISTHAGVCHSAPGSGHRINSYENVPLVNVVNTNEATSPVQWPPLKSNRGDDKQNKILKIETDSKSKRINENVVGKSGDNIYTKESDIKPTPRLKSMVKNRITPFLKEDEGCKNNISSGVQYDVSGSSARSVNNECEYSYVPRKVANEDIYSSVKKKSTSGSSSSLEGSDGSRESRASSNVYSYSFNRKDDIKPTQVSNPSMDHGYDTVNVHQASRPSSNYTDHLIYRDNNNTPPSLSAGVGASSTYESIEYDANIPATSQNIESKAKPTYPKSVTSTGPDEKASNLFSRIGLKMKHKIHQLPYRRVEPNSAFFDQNANQKFLFRNQDIRTEKVKQQKPVGPRPIPSTWKQVIM